ncbi:MAG: endonuclease/exonuclease/phosphatase family protein [Akkermansiaceae bacterium]
MRRWLPRLLIVASLALHAFTAACYIRQPDMMAAYTVYPIWMWGLLGLFLSALAFVFWRAPLSMLLVILWSLTILIASDEAHVLAHIGYEKPEPGPSKPYNNQDTLRICTLNWGTHNQTEKGVLAQAEIVASYHPDIVFLQEIHPWQARLIADKLYDGGGDYRTGTDTAVITRWKVHVATHNPMRHSQQISLKLPNRRIIDCVNFHLRSARTDMRLWTKSCWQNHSTNRKLQRREVTFSLDILRKSTPFPTNPVICAGDFNAPASDPLHDLLRVHFNDSFSEAGTGWANTWHRRIPLHRIDYIYTSPLLKAVRSHTVKVPASDHRMLVSDFLLMP